MSLLGMPIFSEGSTGADLGLALINMLQVVALAWIAFQQYKNHPPKS